MDEEEEDDERAIDASPERARGTAVMPSVAEACLLSARRIEALAPCIEPERVVYEEAETKIGSQGGEFDELPHDFDFSTCSL